MRVLQAKANCKRIKKSKPESRQVSLRIKKKWLEAIGSGTKKVEYREFNAYYQRLFLRHFDTLQLHYQTSRRVIVEVKGVRVEDLDTGESVFAIDLGRVLKNVA